MPLIIIKLNNNEFKVIENKVKPTYEFNLKKWKWTLTRYENGNIKVLGCRDSNGSVRFKYKPDGSN